MAEVFELERSTTGDEQAATTSWLVRDATSYADVINTLNNDASPPAGTPATFAGLPKQRVSATEIAERLNLYYGTVEYSFDSGLKKAILSGNIPQPSNYIDTYHWEVNVRDQLTLWLADLPDGTGAVQGSPVVGNKPGGGSFDPINREGINWQGKERGYEGALFPRPRGTFSLGYTPRQSDVNDAYLDRIEANVGTTNSVVFMGKQIGECLFLGARGEGRTKESFHFDFQFSVAKDRATVTVGNGITLNNVAGWDYIEVTMERKRETLAGEIVITETPRQARVIRPFSRVDFNKLLDASQTFP